MKAATVGNAVNGFAACGIEPFNSMIFSDADFAPAATTDRHTDHQEPAQPPQQLGPAQPPGIVQPPQQPGSSSPEQPGYAQLPQQTSPAQSQPSTSKDVSPWGVRPLPYVNRPMTKGRSRVACSVITSSPVKTTLEAKAKEQKDKELRITLKADARNEKRLQKDKERLNGDKKKIKRQKLATQTIRPKLRRPYTTYKPCPSTSEQVSCPACDMDYSEPPTEVWIACCDCGQWWYESCSNYEGTGQYRCDYC